jgi:hypothetical protein
MKKKLVIISLAIKMIKVGSLVALFLSISLHTFRGLGGSLQQEYSSSNCYVQVSLTYHQVFYVCLKHQNFGSMSLKTLVVS